MENKKDSDRQSVEKSISIGKCCWIEEPFYTDDTIPVGSVHDRKSEDEKEQTSKYKVHHIFHQNISGIFCSGKSGFTHCKSSLHKVNKRCTDNCPDNIKQ